MSTLVKEGFSQKNTRTVDPGATSYSVVAIQGRSFGGRVEKIYVAADNETWAVQVEWFEGKGFSQNAASIDNTSLTGPENADIAVGLDVPAGMTVRVRAENTGSNAADIVGVLYGSRYRLRG